MSKRAWTEDELMILEITMIEKDLTYEELGVMFERTKQAVANKAYKIRKERNITSNRWTKSELADEFGLTVSSIVTYCVNGRDGCKRAGVELHERAI